MTKLEDLLIKALRDIHSVTCTVVGSDLCRLTYIKARARDALNEAKYGRANRLRKMRSA
jgi:hypothetical protein